MIYYEIPVSANPQRFTIRLSGVDYVLTLKYANVEEGGWILDIADASNVMIVASIPLVTGTDLLGQYKHHGFGGGLWCQTKGDPDSVPTWDNLGVDSFLFWVTNGN